MEIDSAITGGEKIGVLFSLFFPCGKLNNDYLKSYRIDISTLLNSHLR